MGTLNTAKSENCDTAVELNQSNRGRARVCLIAILVIQVIAMVFWGSMKQGFHHDEILTFQISNDLKNTDYLAVHWRDGFYDTWHNGAYYSEALVAQEEHLFDYHGVYQKLTHDVGPVFYYYGIHTLCSLFPNVFSKWLGIVPNILYFVITQIVLYAIGCRLSKSRCFGLLTVVAYGFSASAISSVVFIRMYALLVMWGGCLFIVICGYSKMKKMQAGILCPGL